MHWCRYLQDNQSLVVKQVHLKLSWKKWFKSQRHILCSIPQTMLLWYLSHIFLENLHQRWYHDIIMQHIKISNVCWVSINHHVVVRFTETNFLKTHQGRDPSGTTQGYDIKIIIAREAVVIWRQWLWTNDSFEWSRINKINCFFALPIKFKVAMVQWV